MKNLYLKIQNYLRLKLKNNKIQYKIKDLISSVFNIDKENINEDNQSSNWDSLKHMNLILALEDEFNLKFKNAEIIKMNNYLSVLEILSKKLNKT